MVDRNAPVASSAEPKPKKTSSPISKLIAGGVFVVVLFVIIMRGDQLVELAETMKRGIPVLIAFAVLTQFGKYAAQGFAFRACYNVVGEQVRFRMGLSLVFGIFFVNTIAPSLNLAGTSLVVDRSIRHGISGGKGASVSLLVQLCIDSGFALIMLAVFAVLALTVGLDPGWLFLAAIVVVVVGALAGFMVFVSRKPDMAERVAEPIIRVVNCVAARFKRGPYDDVIKDTVSSFAASALLITKYPAKTARAFGFTITSSVFEIASFFLVGMAFGIYSPEALICGYVVATLFAMISITPQGVGVVEAAVVVAFGLFGVPSAAALTIVMVYRAIVFWMPFLIGAVVVQIMSRSSKAFS